MNRKTGNTLLFNLERIRERVAGACARAGRRLEDVLLVAVSKTVSAEGIALAYEAGVRHFGENRVEEALPKIAEVSDVLGAEAEMTWHMVGHLQRRKVRDAMYAFDWVHSVDSLRVAREISKRLSPLQKTMPVLLEVNVSGEDSKFGFSPASLREVIDEILALPLLEVRGLMTMAPMVPDPEEARPVFRRLREFRDELAARYPENGWGELSMGMTDDFEPAIEEGATMVRIGRAVFASAAE